MQVLPFAAATAGELELLSLRVEEQFRYRDHQAGKPTSTNPIASIFAWTRGLIRRGDVDGTPDVVEFANTVERVCVESVESGHMTKDLASLIGKGQKWETTDQFLDTLDVELKRRMG